MLADVRELVICSRSSFFFFFIERPKFRLTTQFQMCFCLIPPDLLPLVRIFKWNVCTLIIMSGRALQSSSFFICTHTKYKLILENGAPIMLQSVNFRIIKNTNMLSSFAGESLSREVQMKSGGTDYYSLCFLFGCCSCATDKPWPESCLSVFILTFLLHVGWLWSKIIGLCSLYCWNTG